MPDPLVVAPLEVAPVPAAPDAESVPLEDPVPPPLTVPVVLWVLPLADRTVPDPTPTVPLLVEPLPTLVEPLPGPPPFDPLGDPLLLWALPLDAELPLTPTGVTVGVALLQAAPTTRAAHGPAWSQSLCFICIG